MIFTSQPTRIGFNPIPNSIPIHNHISNPISNLIPIPNLIPIHNSIPNPIPNPMPNPKPISNPYTFKSSFKFGLLFPSVSRLKLIGRLRQVFLQFSWPN